MERLVDASGSHKTVYESRKPLDAQVKQRLHRSADDAEGQPGNQQHDQDEKRDGCPLSGENAVQLFASQAFLTFSGLLYTGKADFLNKGISHICNGGAAIQAAFFFHLKNNVLDGFFFVSVQIQTGEHLRIPFHNLGGCKTNGNPGGLCVILHQMGQRVKTPVDSAAVIVFVTEVLTHRSFLIMRHMNGMLHQLMNAFIFGGGDGNHGDTQRSFHGVNIDGTAVCGELIHHV